MMCLLLFQMAPFCYDLADDKHLDDRAEEKITCLSLSGV